MFDANILIDLVFKMSYKYSTKIYKNYFNNGSHIR